MLRDVLGYSTGEVAAMLETSTTAIKGAVQRARAGLNRRAIDPERTALPDSPHERELARRFAAAFTAGDVDGVIALLTDDAWLAMPPAPHEYQGRAAIGAFLTTFTTWCGHRRLRLVPTRANAQPAFGCYLTGSDEPSAHPAGLIVLSPSGDRIRAVTWFLDETLPRRFGLPASID
ncbi:nuclear transport factor 2 family protein [Streptomyces sp. 8K308]|uniref:nuclear transport factor 2 family protein n=1 Tax=Streptomyces sp. 8K308 TaxID=2530388 RepID=UPI001FB6517C|nr:nuclear transport factor 2 family protein [Streptomyces sp. 8K308]